MTTASHRRHRAPVLPGRQHRGRDQDAQRRVHRDEVDRARHLGEAGREEDPPEEEVAHRERRAHEEQGERAPLASAQPEAGAGGDQPDVAPDQERREVPEVAADAPDRGAETEFGVDGHRAPMPFVPNPKVSRGSAATMGNSVKLPVT